MLDLDNIIVKTLNEDNIVFDPRGVSRWHNGGRCEAFENDAGRENR